MSYIIVAVDECKGISKDSIIPWKDTLNGKEDIARFKSLTINNAVLMGWNTYLSIKKPLKNRLNIIVTANHYEECLNLKLNDVKVFKTLIEAITFARTWELQTNLKCFIIGGETIYEQYLKNYNFTTAYVTIIPGNYNCDKFYLDKTLDIGKLQNSAGNNYLNIPGNTIIEECNYLKLFNYVFQNGTHKTDRTGTGTISCFSPPELRFSLKDGNLPVLTTKSVAIKTGVIPELLWFMRGETDSRILESQGCNIWKGNTSLAFLQGRNLPYKEKDMGPGYGFQWRHSGAEYYGMDADYTGKGVDQLNEIITSLKSDPDSRRMLMVSWTAPYIKAMALPPCHVLYQVYSSIDSLGERVLSAKMYQRSADSFLGVPFNITSYAILTHIIANMTGHKAQELIMTFGDYHIYKNHLEQVNEQLLREPRGFPKIVFNEDLKNKTFEFIKPTHFTITNYSPHGKISAPMAV